MAWMVLARKVSHWWCLVNLSRLDLNLVLALRALLEERNVTRAA